ncbi:MAG: hypothetical protein CME60_06955 [Halobacteriovoraceae bacterium]|nr:hypothetical protein [Halobacteriovoraceae bacterium]
MRMYLIWILFVLSNLSFAQKSDDITPIKVGSKIFTEGQILGEMMTLVLNEKLDHPATAQLNFGGTKVVFDALLGGDIDIYPEYTGTGYVFILKKENLIRDPERIYKEVALAYKERYQILWSPPMGFNNSYALVVRKDDPRFSGISKLSQLPKDLRPFRYASPHEFMERTDGFRSFKDFYQFQFDPSQIMGMDAGLMYSALKEKQVDMIMAYATDGRIEAYHLKTIKDDLHFFPPYWAAWNFKEKTLKKYPILKEATELFHNLISEEEMIQMNAAVDEYKRSPKEVARNFLIKKGILTGKVNTKSSHSKRGVLEFLYQKRFYLYKIMKEHIQLSSLSLFLAILISLPLGILLTRYQKISGPVFAVINTLQTIPSLALLGLLIPLTGIGFVPAITALFLYCLLPLIRNTYTGIQGVDSKYIEASKGMGLTSFQILKTVEIPLALPVILAGVRTSSVIVIGTATLAALVGAGGLGEPIFRGVATINSSLILLGAIPSALLAILVDKALSLAERKLISKGLQLQEKR